MIRVAFINENNGSWIGGVNYFLNLFAALEKLPEKPFQIIVFVGSNTDLNQFAAFPSLQFVKTKALNTKSLEWYIWRLSRTLFTKDIFFQNLFSKLNVDVVSHYNFFGKSSKVKSVAWIPDFQHRHLPHFFSKSEFKRRSKEFSNVAKNSTKVIVSSFHALGDFSHFFPEQKMKASVLQFVVDQSSNIALNARPLHILEEQYRFKGKYFLLPNQFWKHKNHIVIIEALKVLANRKVNPLILCTGLTEDSRWPKHFSGLMKEVSKIGLEHQFRILGMIPRIDVQALEYYSIAIINPSLFEGWSTTVEEGKALGKKLILSDIAVHKEQTSNNASFFSPHDSNRLAEIIEDHWKVLPAIGTSTLHGQNENFSQNNLQRQISFAKQYQELILNLNRD